VCRVRLEFAIAWAAIACVSSAAVPDPARALDALSACPEAGAIFENAEAGHASDGATFRLADGREFRLAGFAAVDTIDGDSETSVRSTAALDARVAGKRVALHGRAALNDRYGKLVAQVSVSGDGVSWLQADLVSAGALRVAPETSEIACAMPLLNLEARARENRKGVWEKASFAVEQADRVEALSAAVGRFAIVEGVIRRVGETSSHTYLDFGRRYNEDFTIMIPRSARAGFAAAGVELKTLRGRHVRVRGVLFLSGGPAIEIRKPASLEILAGGGT
jgi:endonuclease YncB( thermonuclease family)